MIAPIQTPSFPVDVRQVLDWADADPALQRRFRQQLAEQTSWSAEDCDRAIIEYLRFCCVAVRRAGKAVPSARVDAVWHLHLTWSRDYWLSFCPDRLGMSLHHQPALGVSGEREALRQDYAETLHTYQQLFGDPDARWWPAWTVEAKRKPRPRRARRHSVIAWGLLLPAFAASALALGPLDWRGPEFLSLYLTLMGLLLVASLGWRWWQRLKPRIASSAGPDGPPVWQVAYLSGGPQGVVDAAAADLHEQGLLEWDPARKQLVRRGDALPEDPLQRTLLPHLDGPTSRLSQTEKAGVVQQIRDQVVRQGWWYAADEAKRIALISALPWWLLTAFGVLKVAIGLARDRPVSSLVLLVIFAVVIALAFQFIRPSRTAAGRKVLSSLRGRHAVMLRAPRKGQLGLAVALVGTSVLAGTAFADYHTLRHPPSSGDGGGDSSSSDGGSDGGSGCGGCGGD
jgi:uncharacterized protein (TIGR04222 family)